MGKASERKRLVELHSHAAKRFEELFQGLPVACCTCDLEGTIVESNRAFAELTGYTAAESTLSPLASVFRSRESLAALDRMLRRIVEGKPASAKEIRELRKDGSEFWALVSALPLRGASGATVGAIFTSTDITERKRLEGQVREQFEQLTAAKRELEKRQKALRLANDRLKLLAATDGLTGIANRRVFRERLDEAVAEAQEHGAAISLVLFDADKFKSYNDAFGHQAGDEVLKKLASIAKSAIRAKDLVARFGGEEFVIILPRAKPADALRVAERVRLAIESADWPHAKVTASFGVATVQGGETSARELLAQADEALYASKDAGRNRTTHWSELDGARDAA